MAEYFFKNTQQHYFFTEDKNKLFFRTGKILHEFIGKFIKESIKKFKSNIYYKSFYLKSSNKKFMFFKNFNLILDQVIVKLL